VDPMTTSIAAAEVEKSIYNLYNNVSATAVRTEYFYLIIIVAITEGKYHKGLTK
jgi:hypothetical protein